MPIVPSMLSRPLGIFLILTSIIVGIVYVIYPTMFLNEEGFVYPVPPTIVEPSTILQNGNENENDERLHGGEYMNGYHY